MLLDVALVVLEAVHLPPGRLADACGVRDEAFQSALDSALVLTRSTTRTGADMARVVLEAMSNGLRTDDGVIDM